ncbi:hypothetical protein, partial [Flavonifractor plautii]|uniref:hypothetical protein n=1 Tax=Flavonifractor plautii TaxID=292800 RepID=UPI0032BFD712
SRPARYSSTSETFSSKATSFRLPILYSLPMLFSCLLYWEHTNLSRSNMIKNNFCATCAEVKNVFPALLDILVFSTIIQ